MLSRLWGRVTGADKKLQRPNQQASFLGRIGNHTIVFPYGLYADLPAQTQLKAVDAGAALSVTGERPSDTEQGEPVFFHPATNTRIIARNNGDLDIITTEGAGDVNIQTVNANITASADVTVVAENVDVTASTNVGVTCVDATITASTSVTLDTPLTTATGALAVQGGLTVTGASALGGTVTSGGTNIGESHVHAQGVDSGGDTEQNTMGPQ